MSSDDMEKRLAELPAPEPVVPFSAESLVACSKCGRKSAPDRINCLYCGAALETEVSDVARRLIGLRKPETWEKGYNVVIRPEAAGASAPDVAAVAKLLSIDPAVIEESTKAGVPLPLMRTVTEIEAAAVAERLRTSDISVTVVPDEDLRADLRPVRLRGVEIRDSTILLTHFGNDGTTVVANDDVALIVSGSISTRKAEILEKRKRGRSEKVEETASGGDEAAVDIYTRADHIGFRISVNGFDFSCLGDTKTALASENMLKLTQRLVSAAPRAKIVRNYEEVRPLLSRVWDLEHQQDFAGAKRSGFASAERVRVTTTTNLQQFTKYSRLQRVLI